MGLAVVPYVVPVLSPETMTWFSDSVVLPPILALAIGALLYGLPDFPDERERRFWELLAAALVLYLAVEMLDWLPWDTETADLLGDFLYVGFYAALLLALRIRPDRPPSPRNRWAEGLEAAGTLVFTGALAAYYLVVPGIWTPAEYESWVPSLLLFGTLDCYVVAGVAVRWRTTRSPRWRRLYGLLLIPVTLWLLTDMVEALGWLHVLPYLPGGTFLDFVWLAPVAILVVIARVRQRLPPESFPAAADASVGHVGQPSAAAVVGYAIVLSAMHSVLDLAGTLGSAGRNAREVVVLASLPLLLGIAYALDRTLATRARTSDERGQQLEHQLQESQRVEALGTLAGGIAHEFNNLLTVIIGSAQLYAEDLAARGEESPDLASIVEAADRGRALTSQILTFSRRQDVIRRRVDLGVLTEEAVRVLRVTLPASVRIRLEVDRGCGKIWADPHHIHQIILNLATNASHAMDGSGNLDIRIFQQEVPPEGVLCAGGGPCVVLAVRDDGAGMDTKTRARVFEPFFTTKSLGRGTGLGLSVVQGIVTSHGGTIQVDSEPGGGTEFRIFFPMCQPGAVGPPPSASRRRGAGGASPGPSGIRVLVVDNDVNVAETACRVLSLAGFDAVSVGSAREALEAIRNGPDAWDLLVVDQTMPGRSGLDLVADLARSDGVPPAILLAEHPSLISRKWAQAAGVVDVVAKPFTGEALVRAVRAVLPVH